MLLPSSKSLKSNVYNAAATRAAVCNCALASIPGARLSAISAAMIAQTHHERFDGSGYPIGLAGEDIPIEGRITAVADVYDALSSKRPYKEAFSREKCFGIMESMSGSHFDPKVLNAFFAASKRIVEVQLAFMDEVHLTNKEKAEES